MIFVQRTIVNKISFNFERISYHCFIDKIDKLNTLFVELYRN
jgi:hypothetical protein